MKQILKDLLIIILAFTFLFVSVSIIAILFAFMDGQLPQPTDTIEVDCFDRFRNQIKEVSCTEEIYCGDYTFFHHAKCDEVRG